MTAATIRAGLSRMGQMATATATDPAICAP
jgi:hypothetical protein